MSPRKVGPATPTADALADRIAIQLGLELRDARSRETSSTFVLFDRLPGQRRSRRRWVGLDVVPRVEARYRGYADALDQLRRSGRV